MSELLEQIRVVVKARELAQGANEAKKLAMGEWETQHADLLNSVGLLGQQQGEAETRLRELTLQAYAETGNKAPAEGVGIRERTVLTYDGKVAFDWAKAHKMALQLDKKAFEKIAKADTPDFVKVSTEAIATIATELNNLIGE